MPAFAVPVNLAFDTYGSLIAAIAEWMDRTDLTGSVQAMVALAEARMRRELAPHFSEVSAPITVTDGVGSLPADYGTMNRVLYDGKALPQMPVGGVPKLTGSIPVGYTFEAGGIKVYPAFTGSVQALYQPKLPQLSDAVPTNTLLSQHPDLYFFGAMMFAEGFVANDARAALFKGLWDEALEGAKAYFARQRMASPMVPRVAWLP